MNKVMLVGLLFMAGVAGASCVGPYCWDDTGPHMVLNNVGNSNVSQTLTVSSYATSTTTSTVPSAVGQMVVNALGVLYISTSTQSTGSWVKVGAQ